MFTIDDVFGGWDQGAKEHFTKAAFRQIYKTNSRIGS